MRLLLILGLTASLLAPAKAQLAPPNEAGFTMGHVHLNVNDVELNRKFWIDIFGAMPLKREGLPGVKLPGMLILFTKKAPTGSSQARRDSRQRRRFATRFRVATTIDSSGLMFLISACTQRAHVVDACCRDGGISPKSASK